MRAPLIKTLTSEKKSSYHRACKRRKLTPESACRSISVMALIKARARQGFSIFCLIFLAASFSGCGGKPFNVKPRPDVPAASYEAMTETGSAAIQAAAVRDEDFLYETFDANLIMAGLLPVRIKITNSGVAPLALKKASFEIKAADGRKFKLLDARRAYKKLISYYEISVYTKKAYKQAQEDFSSHALDLASPLEAGQSRDGFLFFSVPTEVARETGLALVARRLDSGQAKSDKPVELKLDGSITLLRNSFVEFNLRAISFGGMLAIEESAHL